jgi:hypothetical protein
MKLLTAETSGLLGMSWPELSLIFFLALFIGMVVRLVLSRSTRWARDARMPLDDLNPQDDRTRSKPGADAARNGAENHV